MILSMYVAEGANESGNWKRKFYVAGVKQEGKSVFACMATCMAKADEICKANGERLASFALDHEIKLDALALPESPKDEKTPDPEEFMQTPLGQKLEKTVAGWAGLKAFRLANEGRYEETATITTNDEQLRDTLGILKIAIEQIFGKKMKWLITSKGWEVLVGGQMLTEGDVKIEKPDK